MSRYLCSELVALRHGDAGMTVNLEEIWTAGAAVEADGVVPQGAAVELHCGESRFAGIVTVAEGHEFGYRMEIGFSAETQWSPEVYRPAHLINPADLPAKAAGAAALEG